MKICVLASSYSNSNSIFAEVGDTVQNPALYSKNHEFVYVSVTKENAESTIEKLVQEGNHDYIWNFLWGRESDDVAGVEAVRYLESTGHPILGNSSKYIGLTKLDFKKAAAKTSVSTPKWTTGSEINSMRHSLTYPVIVKSSDGIGSENMTKKSVCHTETEMLEQIKTLFNNNTKSEIIVEEYIAGLEISVIVLETATGNIALEPLIYEFPKDWKSDVKFLDFTNKFIEIGNKTIKFRNYDDNPSLKQKMQELSIEAYESLCVAGSGYARVDLRVDGDGRIYVLEVNPTPAFFCNLGNEYGDDYIISTTFPGGHEKLIDTIIESKIKFDLILQHFNKVAPVYNEMLKIPCPQPYQKLWETIIQSNDYSGTVLDVGCGNGLLGTFVQKYHKSSRLFGIDVSPEMIKDAKHYEKIFVDLIENVIFDLEPIYDHIISVGVFQFIDSRSFVKIITQLFKLAQKSITITVEEMTPEYLEKLALLNNGYKMFNHVHTIKQFPPPLGWTQTFSKWDLQWVSSKTCDRIYGITIRYDKENLTK